MFIKLVILLTLPYISFSLQENEYLEIISLVTDFMVKQNNPTKVIAYICWPKRTQLEVWKRLSQTSYSAKIAKMNSSIYYSLPEEHQMFLLDVDCEGSIKIMQQV
nr:ionotropic receptor [Semanotus bifasciatus]